METTERARLRALCETATPGPECTGISARWCPRCGDCACPGDTDRGDPMDDPGCPLHARASSHGEDEEHGPDTAAVQRLGIEARTALPALLDAMDAADARATAAERERDEARAEVERLRAAITRLRDNAAEMQSCARAVGHVEEREACAELAEKWLREVDEITQDTPADLADAIRARGTGGAT